MAYLRGEYYVWDDSEGYIHIWSHDGYDGWDESIWAADDTTLERKEGDENASGIAIPMRVLDWIVMMRLAKLLRDQRSSEAIDDAIANSGNFAAVPLEEDAEVIRQALQAVEQSLAQAKPK